MTTLLLLLQTVVTVHKISQPKQDKFYDIIYCYLQYPLH